jgi:hypothetical protein
MVKVRQEHGDRKAIGAHIHGEVRQDLFLNRPWTREGGLLINRYAAALWKAGCEEIPHVRFGGGKGCKALPIPAVPRNRYR